MRHLRRTRHRLQRDLIRSSLSSNKNKTAPKPPVPSEHKLDPESAPVIVADPRSFMRGCLLAWLGGFPCGRQPLATIDAVKAVNGGTVRAPAAVILSASASPAGNAWLNEQAAGVRRALPEVPIVVIWDDTAAAAKEELTVSEDCQGLITMTSSPEIASAVLQLVIAGGHYFPRGHLARRRKTDRPLTAAFRLTPREAAVCELLSQGLSNKVISRRLGMSVSTVKLHVHHILKKLAVRNRTEVAIRITAEPRTITSRRERGDGLSKAAAEALIADYARSA